MSTQPIVSVQDWEQARAALLVKEKDVTRAQAALGRQEGREDSPAGSPQSPPCQWCNWHDAYGEST